MPYKRKGSFLRFRKKLQSEKEKNSLFLFLGLRYTHEKKLHAKHFFSKNVCLSTKFTLRLKKKNWGTLHNNLKKLLLTPSKNPSHEISLYGNCMTSFFLMASTKFFSSNFEIVFDFIKIFRSTIIRILNTRVELKRPKMLNIQFH